MEYLLFLFLGLRLDAQTDGSIGVSTLQKQELLRMYSGFEIQTSCKQKDSSNLDVVALQNNKTDETVFVFVDKIKPFKVSEIKRFKFEKDYKHIEIQCLSSDEAIKRNQTIKDSANAGVDGKIELHKKDGIVCVGTASPAEFKCFRWDIKNSRVVEAGGWTT